jgi:hypothetical protein
MYSIEWTFIHLNKKINNFYWRTKDLLDLQNPRENNIYKD